MVYFVGAGPGAVDLITVRGKNLIEKSDNLPEDVVKDNQDKIQKLTDKYTKIIDSVEQEKEKVIYGLNLKYLCI